MKTVFKEAEVFLNAIPGDQFLERPSPERWSVGENIQHLFLSSKPLVGLFGKPDVTVIVADATRLELNLNLVLQILEITNKAVLGLNLVDEAKRHNIKIDQRELAKRLGIPVVETVARTQKGIPELLSMISDVASDKVVCKPRKVKTLTGQVEESVNQLTKEIESQYPGLPNSRWVAFRLLEGDERITEAVLNNELAELV